MVQHCLCFGITSMHPRACLRLDAEGASVNACAHVCVVRCGVCEGTSGALCGLWRDLPGCPWVGLQGQGPSWSVLG